MSRPARITMSRPRDPFQDEIDAALAAKNPPPKMTASERALRRKKSAMIRSLERVLKMLKDGSNG